MDYIEIGKHCKVAYLPDVPCIEIHWEGMPTSEEFQKGCNTVIELMVSKGVCKVLTDNSKAKLFAISDQHWLNQNWLPRAEKAGYRCSATIIGDSDAFVKFAAQSIASKRDQSKFTNKFFKSREEAISWLKTI